ncbi:hypothetical protein [Occultella gossypii]|uniref:Uncharacterized protein n=1 Tax=Occultella gossypii TaxID=2800820 RepID=A0ABS7SB50_9MICO|nr:hypothetical protein [Occultella gossypii]MBZ2197497.1 hypothetical protein [Occultella gossypii]
MTVFIIGVSGAVGALLAKKRIDRGDDAAGLVRRHEQRTGLAVQEVTAHQYQLADLGAETLASMLTGADDRLTLGRPLLVLRAGIGPISLGPVQPMTRSSVRRWPPPWRGCSPSPGSAGRSSNAPNAEADRRGGAGERP